MGDTVKDDKAKSRTAAIMRDSTFTRFVADQAIVYSLARDLEERIGELADIATDEGLAFSPRSADAARVFATGLNAATRPGAFLIGNGNIRLLWTQGEEQVGLQFREDGTIQYVMFVQRGAKLAHHTGIDDPESILRLITAVGLRHLLGA